MIGEVWLNPASVAEIVNREFSEVLGGAMGPATGAHIVRSLGGTEGFDGVPVISYEQFAGRCYNLLALKIALKGGELKMADVEKIAGEIMMFRNGTEITLSLVRRGNSPWRLLACRRDRKQKLLTLKTGDKKIAESIKAKIQSMIDDMTISGIAPYDTERLFADWLELTEKSVKPRSYKRFRAVTDKAIKFMPPQVHEVTARHIERYKDDLVRRGFGPRSIILELDTLKRIFDKGVSYGYMRKNPVGEVSKPKKPKPNVNRYERKELEAIFSELDRRCLDGCGEARTVEAWRVYREIFYCLLYTGLRVSDVRGLRWENVNLDFGPKISMVQEKTGKEVNLTIPAPFKERLQAMTGGSARGRTGLVFTTTTGNKVSYALLDSAIRAALKSCGIEKKSPIHSFRHTAAMALVESGMPVHQVAHQLGDTIDTVVTHYVKPEQAQASDVDRAFENIAPGKESSKRQANGLKKAVFEG